MPRMEERMYSASRLPNSVGLPPRLEKQVSRRQYSPGPRTFFHFRYSSCFTSGYLKGVGRGLGGVQVKWGGCDCWMHCFVPHSGRRRADQDCHPGCCKERIVAVLAAPAGPPAVPLLLLLTGMRSRCTPCVKSTNPPLLRLRPVQVIRRRSWCFGSSALRRRLRIGKLRLRPARTRVGVLRPASGVAQQLLPDPLLLLRLLLLPAAAELLCACRLVIFGSHVLLRARLVLVNRVGLHLGVRVGRPGCVFCQTKPSYTRGCVLSFLEWAYLCQRQGDS
jgi:hypothetical protein